MQRFPRFRRVPEIAAMALTARDTAIIQQIFRHRFLRSTHLQSLILGSRQQMLRRLQLLFHNGYVNRPRAQIDYYRHGSKPMVYGMGNKGAQLLAHHAGIPSHKLNWTARDRGITRFFMEHALAVADVMVALELSCRVQGLQVIHEDMLSLNILKWNVAIHHGGAVTSIGVVPDRAFGLQIRNGTRWFFLEADRGTMPVERNNLKQTSFYRKLLAYHETWRQKTLSNSFPRFQVLTVTATRERVKNLVDTTHRITQGKGAGLFLFTDHENFTKAANIFQLQVLNGRGEEVLLLD